MISKFLQTIFILLQFPLLWFQDLEFSDVICLELPKDPEGQSDARTYSYQDLVDLQSRLMLVVGHDDQGKTNVDRFISVSIYW